MKFEGGSLALDDRKLRVNLEPDRLTIHQDDRAYTIPMRSITEISYGNDVHRRVGAAIGIGAATLGLGALMALSKTKKHYVGLSWTDTPEMGRGGVAFKVGKGEYRGFIAALEGLTGPMGIVAWISVGDDFISPAHAYLLSHLAYSGSTYLVPLLPIPGYLCWPGIDVERAGASPQWDATPQFSVTATTPQERRLVNGLVRDLMPKSLHVRITPLRPGVSGAGVFKLTVTDAEGRMEVPRVLKLGSEEMLTDEFRAYHRYVENKRVGHASRIEIGRVINHGEHSVGAIVYLLVGGGEKAEPWSAWAKSADWPDIERAVERLYQQLRCWYETTVVVGSSSLNAMVREPFVVGQLKNYLGSDVSSPTHEAVCTFLTQLSQSKTGEMASTKTCVIHADLHCDNVFTILSGPDNAVTEVAIIDWGNVPEGKNPLLDIAKLMADVLYRVRYRERDRWVAERDAAWRLMQRWAQRLGFPGLDWQLGFIHQVSKMLFHALPGSTESFFPPARRQAWKDIQEIADAVSSPVG